MSVFNYYFIITMSRNLSGVALTVALFAGMWGFSSCSQQDSSPKTEILNPDKYSQIPLSLDVEAVLQPLAESSPRAVSLELDDSKKKFPKLKGLTDGSKILCVIRSSNPAQPVNYIQATWTKKENGTKASGTLRRSVWLLALSCFVPTGRVWSMTCPVSPSGVRCSMSSRRVLIPLPSSSS